MYLINVARRFCLARNSRIKQFIIFFMFVLAVLLPAGNSFAAPADIGRYQVVPGSGDNSYLVDTASGYVWVLTYRTLATGREPIAIPYKFIKISPKNQKEFLVENIRQEAPLNTKEGD
jgi:hypothetical protein